MSNKGITLIELIIAITLLFLVLAAATSVDMAGQRFFKTTSEQAGIQDEVQPAMEHMVKNVQLANYIPSVSPSEIRIRIDYNYTLNKPGNRPNEEPNNTPNDPSDDTWITYEKSGNEILCSYEDRYGSPIRDSETIAKGIVNPDSDPNTDDDIFSLSTNGIFLTIKLVGERVIQETPEIKESATLISGVTLRCRAAI